MTPSMIEQIIKLRKSFKKSPEIVSKLEISDSNCDRVLQFLGYHGEHELRRCGGIIDYSQDLSDKRYRAIAEYAVQNNTPADKAAIIFKVSRHRLRTFIKERKEAGEQISSYVAEVPSNVSLTKEYDPCSRTFRTSVAQALKPVEEPEAPMNRPFKGEEAKTKPTTVRHRPSMPSLGSGYRISRAPKLSLDLEPVKTRVSFKPPVDELAWPTQSITTMIAEARAKAIAAAREAYEKGEELDFNVPTRFVYNPFSSMYKAKAEAKAKRRAQYEASRAKKLKNKKPAPAKQPKVAPSYYRSSDPRDYD